MEKDMEEDSLCPGLGSSYKYIGGRRLEALVPWLCEGVTVVVHAVGHVVGGVKKEDIEEEGFRPVPWSYEGLQLLPLPLDM